VISAPVEKLGPEAARPNCCRTFFRFFFFFFRFLVEHLHFDTIVLGATFIQI
jgi:hypothetical protein